jgi:hypothetical protein
LYGAFLVKKFKQGSASFSITLFFVGCESPFPLPNPGFVRTTANQLQWLLHGSRQQRWISRIAGGDHRLVSAMHE